jgi:hypothetical protein
MKASVMDVGLGSVFLGQQITKLLSGVTGSIAHRGF